MSKQNIIVIGASYGGIEAVSVIAASLPKDFAASVFVVIHLSPEGPSILPSIISRAGGIAAYHALDQAVIECGRMYVAQPDNHLLLKDGHMRVVHGPRENRHRPAIDPLFRSAANSYGPRVVGVILTGFLDDGTAGLKTIKSLGGKAIVQDPWSAVEPSMPRSAMQHVDIDHVLHINEIGPMLVKLANTEAPDVSFKPPAELEKEIASEEVTMSALNDDDRDGKPSPFSCPECGGVLWEIEDGNLIRYRCRVGHAFSSDSMQAEQSETVEAALWTALKTLEETASLMRQLIRRAEQVKSTPLIQRYSIRLREAVERANLIRKVILKPIEAKPVPEPAQAGRAETKPVPSAPKNNGPESREQQPADKPAKS